MAIQIAYAAVFVLGAVPFIEVLVAIPLAAVAGLNVFASSVAACAGNMATLLLAILLMDRVLAWRERRRERQGRRGGSRSDRREKRASKIWERYGLPGLALISPLLIGSHLGALLAMGFGSTRRQTTLWMTASVLAWTAAAGVLSHYGVEWVFGRTGMEGLLIDLLKTGRG